jgi:hypothetical protein
LSENDCAQQLRQHAAQTSQHCAAAECIWVAADALPPGVEEPYTSMAPEQADRQ